MQYVWQHRLWLAGDMTTVDGRRVDVLDPGLLNTDAGPDFFNAKVRIGDNLWVGNVEIHVRASDWFRHGHDSDPAYDSVVLHVVEHSDASVPRRNGSVIPQLVMPCAANFSAVYSEMVNNRLSDLPCAAHIRTMPSIYLSDWTSALGFERLYQKSDRILEYLGRAGGDWRQAIYITLARSLGFGVNNDPFERLAVSTPLRHLLRHCGSPAIIEGTLFGQAGLLDDIPTSAASDPYVARLRQEYSFVKAKYGLQSPKYLGWKMARMRPPNFPHRRIALLGSMVNSGFDIGYRMLDVRSADEARALFDISLPAYWHRRFGFGEESTRSINPLSPSSITSLIINAVVPVLHAYGTSTGHTAAGEAAVDILTSLPAEDNTYVRTFAEAGLPCHDAFGSQALVQLRRNYCQPRKCLYCRIGHRYLASHAIRRTPQAIQH